jgi:hypothetical protein
MITFENKDLKIDKINAFLNSKNIASLEEAKKICDDAGLDVLKIVKNIQPISFDDAGWAYVCGAAAAIKTKTKTASETAMTLGDALQSFCRDGSVADERQVGIGHGKLAAMVLSEEVKCFVFIAGHESFAAAEGAIGIIRSANKSA